MMSNLKAFTTGVNGTQGGAVARHLVSKGWAVSALIRNPDSEAAQELRGLGVQLTTGDYDNTVALEAAMQGCQAIFIAMMPDFMDLSAELKHTHKILDIAKKSGVKIVVNSTGFCVNDPDFLASLDQDHFVTKLLYSKAGIEKAVATAGFDSHTILRPGSFMANFILPKVPFYKGLLETGVWTTALRADTQVPLVDEADIARFAVAAMEHPENFNGKGIQLHGDVMTPADIMAAISHATGRKLSVKNLTDEEVEEGRKTDVFGFVYGQVIARDLIRFADMDDMKTYGVHTGTFAEYLEREKAAFEKTYLQ